MKILLSNDDGIFSDGIILLAERLSSLGHIVTVCAPKSNQSATSHSITMRMGYAVKKLSFPDRKAAYFEVDGRPIDCVLFGISGVNSKPDLIIGGINNDKNLGSDTIYSGTVGIACEGALCGIPSLAVSVFYGETKRPTCNFLPAIDFVADNLQKLYQMTKKGSFLNINIPVEKSIQGVKICPLAKTEYDMSYSQDIDGNYILSGVPYNFSSAKEGSDIYYVTRGYVTITPLTYEMTDYNLLEKLIW